MLFEPMDYRKKKQSEIEELLRKAGRTVPLRPLPMPRWTPTPTAPFAGVTAYDWKNPALAPQMIGTVQERPHGTPPGLSARELEQWKLNNRKQLEEMFKRFQYGPSHRNF